MIGGGYVGLVPGACFADLGVEVGIVESDPARLAALAEGRIPIYQLGLDRLAADNISAGRLGFSGDLAATVAGAEAVFIAVGTGRRIAEIMRRARPDLHVDVASNPEFNADPAPCWMNGLDPQPIVLKPTLRFATMLAAMQSKYAA